MKIDKKNLPIYLSALILASFTVWFLLRGNFEFLTYTVAIGLLIFTIKKTDKLFNYLSIAKWGFSLWLLLHLAGGSFYFGGTRLYDIVLFPLIGDPYFILRFDQVMHIYSFFVLTLFAFSMVLHIAKEKVNPILLGVAAFLVGMGIGALNEIIEFTTVVLFNSTGVGTYTNNALDLVFNSIGALIAVFFMTRNNRRDKK